MIWSIAEFENVYGSDSTAAESGKRGLVALPPKHIESLKELIVVQPQHGDDNDASAVLALSHQRGIGDVVSARNYVGTISFANGDQLEILPKLAKTFDHDNDGEKERLRAVLIRMLRAAFDLDAKSASVSDQRLARLPVLEAFFKAFLDCVADIDASLYVLDTVSNMSPALVAERMERFLRGLAGRRCAGRSLPMATARLRTSCASSTRPACPP